MDKLPISAVIVTFNEEKYLEESLKSIGFCEEIIVVDLGSTDKTIEIAEKYATKIVHHDRVPIVEQIHVEIHNFVKNKWCLITDPDEITSDTLRDDLINLFKEILRNDDKIGAVIVPWVFFFKKRRLKGTIWGGINERVYLVHLDRFVFSGSVHRGRKVKEGYLSYNIKYDPERDNVIYHYWMQTYRQLIQKHKRYIQQECEYRYKMGEKSSLKTIIIKSLGSFKSCFWNRKGYKDGVVGLFLSVFWAWYTTKSDICLYKINRLN